MTRPAPALERADKWISRAATATVAGLAGIAGAISYSHMRQLAAAHGDAGWHAHAFPLSVDGVEIVASLVLLADRRAGRKSVWLPWAALTIGTVASLAANIATAETGVVSRIIAGWPAVALLIAVKLLSSILENRGGAGAPARSLHRGLAGPAGPGPIPSRRTGPAGLPANGSRNGRSQVGRRRPVADHTPDGIVSDDIAALERAALAIRDELRREGSPLTRDALAARLRAAGHPVRNARLTTLLAALRADQAPVI